MKTIPLLAVALVTILMSYATTAQTTVSYQVEHATDAPSTASGCSNVSLSVTYTMPGGGTYLATSTLVQLDQNQSASLSTTIPSTATVLTKKIVFSFNSSANTYQYLITNASNSESNSFVNCNCPPVSSKYLMIQENAGKHAKVIYYITDVVSGGC